MLPGAVVLSRSGVPVIADFANATGTPIVIDLNTGNAYALINEIPTLLCTASFINSTTTQSANTVLAGPASGAVAAPTFRALVPADYPLSAITASLAGDVALNNVANYFDGPSVAQGTVGTWFVTGSVTVTQGGAADNCVAKLWDGTTVISSVSWAPSGGVSARSQIALSGFISSPAGNIRISVKDATSTASAISFNQSGNSKDSTITAVRIA